MARKPCKRLTLLGCEIIHPHGADKQDEIAALHTRIRLLELENDSLRRLIKLLRLKRDGWFGLRRLLANAFFRVEKHDFLLRFFNSPSWRFGRVDVAHVKLVPGHSTEFYQGTMLFHFKGDAQLNDRADLNDYCCGDQIGFIRIHFQLEKFVGGRLTYFGQDLITCN